MITKSREDYLRAIFCLNERNNDHVKSIDIVKFLHVSKPAVSEMLKTLKKEKLIAMNPYSSISLTPNGEDLAKKITYIHRITEVFLKDILKFREDGFHEEAHKLEHSMSLEVATKIAAFLKNPKVCPCGHKIPIINK